MLLTEKDQKMFSKYYGRMDLLEDDSFWVDVLEVYRDTDVTLPLVLNLPSFQLFFDYFDCPPGKCGECCNKYLYTPIKKKEIDRIVASSSENAKLLTDHLVDDPKLGKAIYGPCPFLKDNVCTIHDIRPNTCYFFPVMYEKQDKLNLDGKEHQAFSVRIKCQPGIKAVRQLFRDVMGKNDKIVLLPNLNLINKE